MVLDTIIFGVLGLMAVLVGIKLVSYSIRNSRILKGANARYLISMGVLLLVMGAATHAVHHLFPEEFDIGAEEVTLAAYSVGTLLMMIGTTRAIGC